VCGKFEADTGAKTSNFILQIRVLEHRKIVVMTGDIGSHVNTRENYKGKT